MSGLNAQRRCRLAILASHPIQYFTPVYRLLHADPALAVHVFFYRDFGVTASYDKQFGREVRWDVDQLGGYPHTFLGNVSPVADPFNPLHALNPAIVVRLWNAYDAIWMNGFWYPSNWLAAIASRSNAAKLLFRSDMRLDPLRPRRWFDPLRAQVVRRIVRAMDALLYIGTENRKAYEHYGATDEQLYSCPFSVDTSRIEALRLRGDGRALRRRWGIPEDKVAVLFVGKLTERKHPELLLQLCRELGTVGVHGVMVGSGPMEERLKALAASQATHNLTFCGFVNQSRLPELYLASDVFVIPSESEPWGLVVNEALAAGLPILASRQVGCAADLVVEGKTGMVLDAKDEDGWKQAVARLARDAKLRERMGRAAHAHGQSYSLEATVEGVKRALVGVGVL